MVATESATAGPLGVLRRELPRLATLTWSALPPADRFEFGAGGLDVIKHELLRLHCPDDQPRHRSACLHAQFRLHDLWLQPREGEQAFCVGAGVTVTTV